MVMVVTGAVWPDRLIPTVVKKLHPNKMAMATAVAMAVAAVATNV
jgi:hypothetical protein